MIPLGVLASARHAAGGGGALTYVASSGLGGSTSTSRTFTGMALGDAVDRTVLVAVSISLTSGGSITTMTVNGNAATLDVVSSSTTSPSASIYRVSLTAGVTSGDIVVTTSNPNIYTWVSVYQYPGALTVVDTDSQYVSTSVTSFSRTLTTSAGGFAVAAIGVRSNSAGAACAWTGVTEDYEDAPVSGIGSAAHASTTGADITAAASLTGGSSLRNGGIAVATYVP